MDVDERVGLSKWSFPSRRTWLRTSRCSVRSVSCWRTSVSFCGCAGPGRAHSSLAQPSHASGVASGNARDSISLRLCRNAWKAFGGSAGLLPPPHRLVSAAAAACAAVAASTRRQVGAVATKRERRRPALTAPPPPPAAPTDRPQRARQRPAPPRAATAAGASSFGAWFGFDAHARRGG